MKFILSSCCFFLCWSNFTLLYIIFNLIFKSFIFSFFPLTFDTHFHFLFLLIGNKNFPVDKAILTWLIRNPLPFYLGLFLTIYTFIPSIYTFLTMSTFIFVGDGILNTNPVWATKKRILIEFGIYPKWRLLIANIDFNTKVFTTLFVSSFYTFSRCLVRSIVWFHIRQSLWSTWIFVMDNSIRNSYVRAYVKWLHLHPEVIGFSETFASLCIECTLSHRWCCNDSGHKY